MITTAMPSIDEQAIKDVGVVIRSGQLAQGEKVQELEEAFARYIGTESAVAVNTGTSALHLALLAAGIKEGDEVITTAFSFIASGNSILMCGARPAFVDIEPDTYNIDSSLIRARINSRTKAVMPVHLYGQPFDVDAIIDICRDNNLSLVEDACQAHGAEYLGRKAGSFGIGCFSFYATKNMTTGEGGMVTTNDKSIADRCRLLRNHGQRKPYYHDMLGFSYRMTEIEAVIGLSQLRSLDSFNQRRIENAAFLTQEIATIPGLIAPKVRPGRKHIFHQFTIRVTKDFPLNRDQLREHLQKKGILCPVHYPLPICKQSLYTNMGYTDDCRFAEEASKEVLSLPVHPSLTQDNLETIIEALRSV